MQDEPGIPWRCSIFPGRAPHPPRPSRRWGAGAALVVLVAVLGIATPEDAQAQLSAPQQFSVRIAADNGEQATLTWAVPTNGGATITKYQYRYSAGNTVDTSATTATWTDVPDGADADTDAGNETTVTVTGLTGTEYTFEVRAVNGMGPGPAATKTVRAPSAPLQFSVRIAADNGEQATLTWDAPQYVGTTNITRYQYRYSAGNTVDTSATTATWTDVPDGADAGDLASDERTVTVTGLTTGTVYAFELRAVNGMGPGPVVRQTVTAPDEPQQFSVRIAAAQATLTWAVPTNDGGATITKYQYRYSAGSTVDTSVAWSDVLDGADTGDLASDETTVTVTGLTGTVHTFQVRAVNSVGEGGEAMQTVTVPSVPRQFSVRIAADDGTQATLTWAVPTNAGGAPITKYQYRYSAGSMIDTSADWTDVPDGVDAGTDAGNETTVTVTGLITRPPHTFQVRAVNSVGPGDEATKTVTVPSKPLQFSVRITADDGGQATLTWDAPMFVGTTNITRYQYRYSVGDPDDTSAMWSDWTDVPDGADVGNHASDERTVTVTGLTTGTDTFQVRAVNDGGGGPAAKQTVTAPDEPQQFSVRIAAAQATLTWAVPTNDGGATITKYQYRYSAGSTVDTSVAWSDVPDGDTDADTDAGNETTVTVTGLTGTVHAFEVRAVNSVGPGRVATQTVTVTAPSEPRQFSVMIAAAQATLTWAVPTNDGGTTITKYQYRYSAGNTVDTSVAWSDVPDGADTDPDAGNETTVTVTGLTGTVHTFQVRAVNSVGAGDAATQTVTVPSEPRRFLIFPDADDREAGLQWSVPTSDGGAPITAYEYRYAVGTTVPASTMWTSQTQTPPDDTDAIAMMVPIPSKLRTAVVTGLTTNTQYAFEVRARNSAGVSDPAMKKATVPRPLIELSWNAREAWLGPSFTLTITFSEAVTGFMLNDLSMHTNSRSDGLGVQSGVETANFQTISAMTTYSVEVTPVPSHNQRALAVSVTIDRAAVHKVDGGAPNERKNQVIDLILPVTGTEIESLTALYNATDGANWTSKDNWLDDDMDLDDWYGVTTNTDGEVTELDLENNELSGSLPVELGNLRNLTHLYLHRNALSGPIPPDLGLFENLEHLHLHRNALSGAIPERLGRLNLLEQLYLQGNKLSGPIPPEFRPNSLVDLKLHSNTDLSEPLPAISPTALPNLKELGMQNTGVTIPDTQAFTDWGARITSGTQTSDGVITLDADNTRPTGLWADGTTLYVVGEDGGKVYAYTWANGERDSAKDITLDTANTHPTGLWSDGTTLWVLDYDGPKIYAYTLAGGGRDTDKDIESVPAGYGLWGRKDATCTGSDATCLLWVARAGQLPIRLMAYRIYADTSASVTYGSANTGFDKALPTSDLIDIESDVSGFWWEDPDPEPDGDPPTVWISDRFDAALYAYSANPRMAGESSSDIVSAAMQNRILEPDNLSPTAFWSDGTMWWVADLYAGKVFVYGLSAPPPVIMQDPLGMPQSFSAMPGDTQEVVLSWTAPASDGGEAITKYQYRYSAGSTVDTSATTATWTDVPDGADADTDTSDETTFTVTGLTNGMQYAFQVRAWNSGAGPPTTTDTATPTGPSTDATLSALALSNGSDITLDPSFASGTTSYTASVASGVDEITITPTVNESNATVQYQDSSDMDITDADDTPENGHQVPLDVVGENTIKVKVTAEDNITTETYTVTVTRAEPDSTDATLSALALSNGSDITLSPLFASGTMSYTASVASGVDEITITPTVNESNATVQYQDNSDMDITDADDAKSGHQVSLDVGPNTIKVKVTAEDGTTTETYTVVVTRAEPDSTDATLSALVLSNGSPITLTPSFASDIMSYTASVPNGVDEITITPTVNESNATVQYQDSSDMDITDADDTPENGHQVPLDVVGENTIKVKVTAEDRTTTETYTVTVTRLSPSADATLSALGLSSNGFLITLDPSFASGTTSYTASVVNGVDEITITPTVNESNATVQYQDSSDMDITDADDTPENGHQVPLDVVGENTIKVKVTAADNITTETYTVTVTRAEPDSTDATLSALALSSNGSPITLTPAFASDIMSYTASSVAYRVAQITIAPTRTDIGASVAYFDGSDTEILDADADAMNGQQVSLTVGPNTIKVKVTAVDSTMLTYTVTVTRLSPSADATLSALGLSSNGSDITLDPSFASGTTSYTASVPNGVDEITITPTVNESNATVEYQDSSDMDITDADDAKSGHQVPLDVVGENTIKVKVTAEDGTTPETYTVVVTRAEPDSTDATLSALALSNASNDSPIALTPTFASSTTSYTASVVNGVDEITITPTVNESNATVQYQDSSDMDITDADDAKSGHQVPLDVVGENTIKVKVTAEDRITPETYTVTVTRAEPDRTDATLSALALSNASDDSPIALTPTFASGTTSYTASVPNGVDEITITPTVNESNATVQYQDSSDMDITDADDTPENGHQVPLDVVGENTIKVKVTAEDGTTTETYTVTVTRAEPDSTDATLSALALSNASNDSPIALTPTFASSTTSYTASVVNGVDEITITPTVNESNATVQYQDSSDMDITDADDTPENGHQVPLDVVGENTIKVKVTAEDGTTTETYTVTVTRAEPDSTDATLSALALSNASNDSPIALTPTFASSTTSYTASVVNGVDEITITPTVNESNATVQYQDSSDMDITDADDTPENGHQVPLDVVGENPIKVKVTAADNITTETYTVTVTRAEPDRTDATLSALGLSSDDSTIELTPSFASDIMSYTASSVAYRVAQITIAATRTDSGARVAYFDSSDTEILDADADATNGQQVPLAVGPNTIKVKVTSADSTMMLTYTVMVTRSARATGTTTSGGTGGGGGGGGGGSSQDDHGNTPAQATPVTLDPTRTASVRGQINTAADMDYFSAAVPHAGVLVVETSGPTATVGTVWQAGAELATAARGGVGQNFRLRVRVAPGSVVIALQGQGGATGAYTLQVTFLSGHLENPGAASFQSGIGVISGWTCDAEAVEIVLNGEPQEAAYGTARLDTEAVCGDSDNGFGLLFNWNLLGDGEHEVVALVDGVELDRATVTVTTLGAEFLRDVTGTCTVEDFPTGDETVTLAWQQTQQNFVIVDGMPPTGANRVGTPGVGYLENPGPNSFQSGIGVLSGWVCEGEEVVIELNGAPQPAAYGTERLDTLAACGDTANGFGLLFNWNLLGEGEHEVVAFVDGEELGRATVRVTTLGAEFVRDVEGECTVEDFPMLGETVTLEWQQNSQNFVITDME